MKSEEYFNIKTASVENNLDQKLVRNFASRLAPNEKLRFQGQMHYKITPEFQRLKKFGRGGCITQSRAKSEYKLKQSEVDNLIFAEVKNPHYSKANSMKLLLKDEVINYIQTTKL